jgi:predicted nucleotidyltransferase
LLFESVYDKLKIGGQSDETLGLWLYGISPEEGKTGDQRMKPTSVTFGPVDERVLQEIVGRIVEAAHPLRIIVFGSVARGEQCRESDVDLLIVMPEGTHRRFTAQMLYQRLRGVAVPIDLVVTTDSDLERHKDNPGLVYRTILREGRVLYAA